MSLTSFHLSSWVYFRFFRLFPFDPKENPSRILFEIPHLPRGITSHHEKQGGDKLLCEKRGAVSPFVFINIGPFIPIEGPRMVVYYGKGRTG